MLMRRRRAGVWRWARTNGISLRAGGVVPAGQRGRLEQVCRYVLRPPVASERLTVAADGRLVRRSGVDLVTRPA